MHQTAQTLPFALSLVLLLAAPLAQGQQAPPAKAPAGQPPATQPPPKKAHATGASSKTAPPRTVPDAPTSNEPGHAGGLSWTPPWTFTAQLTEGLRAATYAIPKAPGDTEAPELAVFYFGQGQGGDVEANVARWSNQLVGKGEKPVTLTRERLTIAGLPVTLVKGEGTYRSGGMGLTPVVRKPGFRLVGAIVEGPQGPVFFKLTGPAKSVKAAEGDFRKLLSSLAAMG